MSRTFTTIVIVTVTMLTTASPAKSDETEVPGGFLVIPAVVLGATDFFFFLGNMVDVRNDQASRARGALAVVFGTATVLTAVGVGVGTEATTFAIGVGAIGLATIGSGVWAIAKADSDKDVSFSPEFSSDRIGIAVRYRW